MYFDAKKRHFGIQQFLAKKCFLAQKGRFGNKTVFGVKRRFGIKKLNKKSFLLRKKLYGLKNFGLKFFWRKQNSFPFSIEFAEIV